MTAFSQIRLAFAQPNFRRYITGNAISLIGNWVQRTAIAWLAWELTGSVTWLGIIAFADLFPAIVIGPFGGVLADRVQRQRVILAAQSIMLGFAVVLAILAWTGGLNRWTLLAVVLAQGITVGINQPARLALVSSLIESPLLPTAVAINSIVFNCARFVGPAIAGVLLVSVGPGWTFFLNALSFLPLLAILARLDLPRKAISTGPKKSIIQSMGQGLGFLWFDPQLKLLLLSFLAFSVLIRPVVELLPAFADGVFAQGASGLAWMSGALGVGAMLGGYALASNANLVSFARYPLILFAATLAFACLLIAWNFPLAVLATGLCGFGFVIAGVGANTILQIHAPDELRGRVLSVYGMIVRASPALGALMLGNSADHFGLVAVLACSMVLFLGLLAWAGWCVVSQEQH